MAYSILVFIVATIHGHFLLTKQLRKKLIDWKIDAALPPASPYQIHDEFREKEEQASQQVKTCLKL